MHSVHNLWKITVTCKPVFTSAVENIVKDKALVVSVLALPRKTVALVEAIYPAKPGKKDLAALHASLAVLAAIHKTKQPKVTVEKIGNIDWLKKVAADFPPLRIGSWTIYGGAHEKAVKNLPLKLRIDASRAFGTGEHPTTRGCLLMLEKIIRHPKFSIQGKALDLGCGSGILAMAYAKATGGKILAIDCDATAIKIARENVRLNGLQKLVKVVKANGYNAKTVHDNAPYTLVMANILSDPLCSMAKDLKRHLAPKGMAILSGILNNQAKDVITAHRKQGLILSEKMRQGEWTILAFKRQNVV